MIAWPWLLLAFGVGAWVGMAILALLVAAKDGESREREWTEEYKKWWLEEKATRELAEARIEALEGCVRSFCEALREWPANTNNTMLVTLAADAERLLSPAPTTEPPAETKEEKP